MSIHVKIQHLATVKEAEMLPAATLLDLKRKVEELFAIPVAQQSLMLDSRSISTSTKALDDLGIRNGSLVVVKRIHRVRGQEKSMDISSLMKNPMVKSMMKNPETMKSIQDMFPDLKEEMIQNKTLSMMINNGGLEEEIEKMSIDSDYMSTQLKNADLTMAKLENIPGGINMMSGMIKDVEDPFKMMNTGPDLKGGNKISEKTTESLPGKSKKNLLVEYRKQLSELKQIGFSNIKENLEVLTQVGGDLQQALEILVQRHDK